VGVVKKIAPPTFKTVAPPLPEDPTRTRFGDWSFAAAGPRIWNSLPPELRRPDTELGEIRRLLKTFFVCLGTAETAAQ